MKPILTPAQMRELDKRTIEELGLPGIVLMELAARGVVHEIDNLFRGRFQGSEILVFCGPGNNGGDGFAIARRLLNLGAQVRVYLFADRDKIKGDALINKQVYQKLGGEIIDIIESQQLDSLPQAHLIVDALLGTGLKGGATGLMAAAIEAINNHPAGVIAVDIPSGVNGANGQAEGPAVRADITATFGGIKVGHLIPPGLEQCGQIVTVDIQIPPEYIDEGDVEFLLIEPYDVQVMLPDRQRSAHKGDAGKVLVVAGSVGMTGAAELAARSCLRAGAGLVKVATAKSAQAILAGRNAEVMTIPVADTENGTIAPDAETTIREALQWADVEVIGPGLSLNQNTIDWFTEHAKDLSLPTAIDADGLNALAKNPDLIEGLGENVILTPHVGEFARLTGLSTEEIESDRVGTVRRFAVEWGVTLLLKGVPSLLGTADGEVYGMLAGNPGMASAGMGDVLTGVIAGFLAQGLTPENATISGVIVHGLAGDLAAHEMGTTGIVAGDVVERLPYAQDIISGRAHFPHQHGGCCGGHGHGHEGGKECNCDGDCDCDGNCEGNCGCGN